MLTTVYHCGFRGQVIINLLMEILSLLISNTNFFSSLCVFQAVLFKITTRDVQL